MCTALSVSTLAGEKKLFQSGLESERWAKLNSTRPEAKLILEKIASVPQAIWLVGNHRTGLMGDIEMAKDKGEVLPLVLYNIPGRDNGNYSAGGLSGPKAYNEWVKELATKLGDAPALCILEPDAIGLAPGLKDETKRAERYQMLRDAVVALKKNKNTKVYIDLAHWLSDEKAAEGLKKAGIEQADGFCLNTSNFQRTEKCIEQGTRISSLVGGKHFIVDTSRNGNGPFESNEKDPWCNPPGRALGRRPTFNTGNPLVDAFLWVKRPGESDGSLRGPKAGQFSPELAYELAKNAK